MNLRQVFLAACLALWAGDEAIRAQDPRTPVQYVFLIDTSFSMARHKPALTESLSELIRTGVNWQWSGGERFTIWTFNEQLHDRRFLPQVWSTNENETLARRATQHIKSQRFERQTRLDRAVDGIRNAIQSSELVTVVLFSDGDTTLAGTPFDRQINEIYIQHRREVRRSRQILLTTFTGRDGRLLTWSVGVTRGINGAIARLNPEAPVRPTAPPQTMPQLPDNNDANMTSSPPQELARSQPVQAATPEPPQPAAVPPPETSAPKPPDPDPTIPPVVASAPNAPAASAVQSISLPTEPSSTAEMEATAAPEAELTISGLDLAPASAAVPQPEPERIPAPAPLVLSETNSAPAPKVELESASNSEETAAPSPAALGAAEIPARPFGYLAAGFFLLIFSAATVIWVVRSNRAPRPSLISRSIEQEKTRR